ncbi:hypothetical protein CU098_003652, partial [Rhizopus stolonifer]
ELMEDNEAEGTQDHGDTEDTPKSGDEKEYKKEVDSIWESWKTLLKTIRESTVLPALSPESHNVIWCGKQVLRRLVLPVDLFQELNNQVPNITIQLVDRALKQMLYDALDTNNKEDWLVKIKTFRNYNSEADLTARRDLMVSIFNIFKYLKDHNNDVTFYPGEIELKAMTIQLKDQRITDKRLKYNADGTILFNRISTEILLSEVSSAFAENSKAKTSFDHYKAMFGLLMMLKTIARRYKYASFNTFKELKVHFIHTHTLKEASCEGSTNENTSPASLLDLVNPVLVRLNENKHKDEVAEDGPQIPSS